MLRHVHRLFGDTLREVFERAVGFQRFSSTSIVGTDHTLLRHDDGGGGQRLYLMN
jgi:hypothetical protein